MWQFMVSAPEKDTKVVELKPGKLTLGRATTNDIVIDDTLGIRYEITVYPITISCIGA